MNTLQELYWNFSYWAINLGVSDPLAIPFSISKNLDIASHVWGNKIDPCCQTDSCVVFSKTTGAKSLNIRHMLARAMCRALTSHGTGYATINDFGPSDT